MAKENVPEIDWWIYHASQPVVPCSIDWLPDTSSITIFYFPQQQLFLDTQAEGESWSKYQCPMNQ